MDPTARLVNVRRSIMAFLAVADLSGARLMDALDVRQSSDVGGPFVRVDVSEAPSTNAGSYPGGGRAATRNIVVSCECYAPDLTNGQPTPVDAAINLCDLLAGSLQNQNVEIMDYAGTGVTSGAFLQFHLPPIRPQVTAIKGWYRASIRFPAVWQSKVSS